MIGNSRCLSNLQRHDLPAPKNLRSHLKVVFSLSDPFTRDWLHTSPFRGMSPEQRWEAARQLYWTVRRHKAAFIQTQHPDWSPEEVQAEVRRIFLHAGT
jgi:hypothetical protein